MTNTSLRDMGCISYVELMPTQTFQETGAIPVLCLTGSQQKATHSNLYDTQVNLWIQISRLGFSYLALDLGIEDPKGTLKKPHTYTHPSRIT